MNLDPGGAVMKDWFEAIARWTAAAAHAGERIDANWYAECSDFVRFNRGRVRQCGSVLRTGVELRLVHDGRVARANVTLQGVPREDGARLDGQLSMLREAIADAQPDPWLLLDEEPLRSETFLSEPLPDPDELADAVLAAAADEDLVGFYMGGPMARGMASSLGHRHFHLSTSWSFDFSVYVSQGQARDKAVKSMAAGSVWDRAKLIRAVGEAAGQLAIVARPPRQLERGRYRVLLSPRANAELLGMIGWDGVSARAHLTGQSALARLRLGQARFDDRLTVIEDLQGAGVPRFQSEGFVRPAQVSLIEAGGFADWLCSPRTAREFSIASNAAASDEMPIALSVAPGDLADEQALAALDTGLAISNLWYLNHSDRQSSRVTGMTRFSTLWVEAGRPVAPVQVMRFDDSLFDLYGPQLIGLGRSAHWIADTSSYELRGFGGMRCPSALLAAMSFTL
jgi:predicted Zn-dependent protease